MNEIYATLILISLFALRFAVPFGILVGFGYILNRIQDRWQMDNAV